MPRGDSSQTVKATLGLRQMLFDGQIQPGERLAELALVERLGVSRTPLRLALARLEREGLLEAIPGGGFAARAFTWRDVDDAIELRGVLEGIAARFAAERLDDPERLEAVRGTLARLDAIVHDEAPDAVLSYASLNDELHAQLIALAGSDLVSRHFGFLTALPFAGPAGGLIASQLQSREWRETLVVAQHQHRAIVEAVAAREGRRAEELAREHARLSRRNLALLLERGEIPERVPGASLVRAAG